MSDTWKNRIIVVIVDVFKSEFYVVDSAKLHLN